MFETTKAIRANLTKGLIESLHSFPDDYERINDTEISGFHIRLGKSRNGFRQGKYYLYYRLGGRKGVQRFFLIGNIKDMTIKQARHVAQELKVKIARGEDPYAERKAMQQEAKADQNAMTVNDLLDEFINTYVMANRKRPEEVIRSFNADVRPTIGSVQLHQLDKRLVIVKCFDPIIRRGSRVQANKTLSLLKQTLDFGVERGLLASNCIKDIRRRAVGGNEHSKKRALSFEEIEQVFTRLPQSGLSNSVQNILRLCLLTGCRVSEVTGMEQAELDIPNRLWTIPAERTKGKLNQGKTHHVHLTDLMIEIIDSQKIESEQLSNRFIFPTHGGKKSKAGDSPIDARTVSKAVNRKLGFFGLAEPFTPHDLRRTCSTRLPDLDVEAVVIEKILNHQLEGMLGIYNQFPYFKMRAEALDKFSAVIKPLMFPNSTIEPAQTNQIHSYQLMSYDMPNTAYYY